VSGLLHQRGVVVTGAGRGLGRAFAMSAARSGAGVVVNDVDGDEANAVVSEITREGGRAVAAAASITDPDAAAEIVDRCVREFGSIDGLINNAVRYGFGHPWDEDPADLRGQLEVNLLGAMYCGAQAMRHMKERRRGSIVNLTSNVMMGSVGMSTYGMAKGALACLTFGWALELMPYGVRVNALAPGAVTRGSDLAGEFGRPNKAPDTPEMIAPAAVFLLSELSAEITGQIVFLMGKRLGLMARPQLIEPVLERDDWTAETIAEAYDRVFRPLLQPVGRAGSSYEWAPEGAAAVQ
jgi:NAD(P)-dependent dehydrogenase (short-subunit alcohol dehydrogenase family)